MRSALVKERLVREMFPSNVTVPAVPASNVRLVAPVTVLEKLMLAPNGAAPEPVLSNVGAPVRETAPVIAIAPPLVIMFPSMLMVVAA